MITTNRNYPKLFSSDGIAVTSIKEMVNCYS
jgi:hypothetical protein